MRAFGAEREGFEPPEPRSSTVFKTAAIDHSAIFPKDKNTISFRLMQICPHTLQDIAFLSFFYFFCKQSLLNTKYPDTSKAIDMNKTQLIDAMASETGMTKAEARKSLEAFMKAVATTLNAGDKVTLAGFGTFTVEKKHARMGRDPRNGAPIRIAAKNVVKFRPSNELCDVVN